MNGHSFNYIFIMHKLNYLLLLFLLSLLSSCDKKNNEKVSRGFYYWKSKFQLEERDQKLLKSLYANKIYVKFFDVDWNDAINQPMPYGTIQPKGDLDSSFKIVPTIFITNRTFEKLNDYEIGSFSSNVHHKITELLNCFESPIKLSEVQIDCDWGGKTQRKYFDFLDNLKTRFRYQGIKVSSTIRLHQVKYFEKTGVPPVDKGMLMFYNMGDVTKPDKDNSIFNVRDASKYLAKFDKYPLALDVALPVFSWAAVYRKGKLIQLISDFEPSLVDNKNLTEIKTNVFQASKSIEMKTFLVKAGDIIKFDIMTPENTIEAASLVKPHLNDSVSVILFDYNNLNLKRYNESDFEDIFDTFN